MATKLEEAERKLSKARMAILDLEAEVDELRSKDLCEYCKIRPKQPNALPRKYCEPCASDIYFCD